ncbi:MAG: helix-turn-helix domain-containing protein [Mycobacterium sp.]
MLADISLGSLADLTDDDKKLVVDTFRAWLDHNGSVSDTAAALFCHPNTVRYRLRRIEERTGRSLNNPRQLAELCLAFEVTQRT